MIQFSNGDGLIRRKHLYRQLSDILRDGILSGAYMDGRLPTERDLSATFGVSVAVIKQAVDILVSEGLVYRIPRKGMRIGGSASHADSRALSRPMIMLFYDKGRTDFVKLGHSLYSRIIDSFKRRASAASASFSAIEFDLQDEMFLKSLKCRKNMLAAVTFFHKHAKALRPNLSPEIPVVSVDHCVYLMDDIEPCANVSYVACDNLAGAVSLAEHVRGKGHRKAALAGFDPSNAFPTNLERIEGLANGGFDCNKMPCAICPDSEWLQKIIREKCTVIIAFNDLVAIQVLNNLHYMGAKVPDDVSLVCFDDIDPLVSKLMPPISAMAMPCEEMADAAWKSVCGKTSGANASMTRLPYSLVERDSVKAITVPL